MRYNIRNILNDDDLWKKNKVNSAAFNIEGLYPDNTFKRLQDAPTYNQELDVVIENSGKFIATCTGWYDEVNKIGHIEPLGVHPHYQRKGLGKIIVYEVLDRLKRIGARSVNMVSDENNKSFYKSFGFKEISKSFRYEKHF